MLTDNLDKSANIRPAARVSVSEVARTPRASFMTPSAGYESMGRRRERRRGLSLGPGIVLGYVPCSPTPSLVLLFRSGG